MTGADHHAALSSRPVICRKQTVSHPFISLSGSDYSVETTGVHMSLCLFIISGGTVQSKSYSFSSSTSSSSSNTSKKVGR